ncbi:iron-siderophore ABC transporter substrate-binding protein [Pseudonocardia sp. RS11V-5]|uniref:iron-siderophore ABC transporter substrate-binding protein n=1 Tax=Pseudonocardia terrae TaxID=2905831 RepID=UPI001E5CAB98|nr:iron-siderophore ABC transporter substrate-binding protein [Pseudonocardia terrae]MCE3554392.1 iron-siderophore ABC transporter substrate-binding protein [Pseudonocardia terrae]
MSIRSSRPVRRRWLLAGAAALAVVAGCGGPAEAPAAPQPAQQTAGMPVTITHALGSTTISAPPQRVVTIGWSDQDAVLALGVKPVGTTEWFDEQPGAIFPWATQAAGGTVPEIVSNAGEISFEKVAALEPDLILALYEGLDRSEYDKLAAIAPTVAQSAQFDQFGAPWQDMTLTAGKALGREQQAKDLVAGVEAKLEAVRDAHPDWAQKTMLVGATAEGGTYQVFSPQDPKVRFFADLGFATEPSWLAGRVADNVATVSAEEFTLLDVDRLAWTSDPDLLQVLQSDPIYNRLDVVKDGRVGYFDYTTAPFPGAAITFNTVLSIPYALDQVVPELERMDAKQ